MPTALITTAITATTLVAAAGLAPAAPDGGQASCAFRITATHVLAELTGNTTPEGNRLRELLLDSGVGKKGFLPDRCITGGGDQGGDQGGDPDSGAGSNDAGGNGGSAPEPGTGDDGGSSGSDSGSGSGGDTSAGGGQGGGADQGATAAEALGWGQPDKVDEFENGTEGWNLYDGPGHAGNGTRSPDAASVENGILTINGSGDGTTAGMAWGDGQKYGRWEGRMKAPTGSPSYNALFLLWPSEENFPVGGEIDFAEISDSSRQKVDLFLHYGEDNSQVQGDVEVDATQWNNWAVEWTPDGVTAFLNGKEWWNTTDTSILPPGPMHLCIQLDWFPKGDSETGQMQVDWVKQWSLDGGASASGDQGSADSGGDTGASSDDAESSGDAAQTDQASGSQ